MRQSSVQWIRAKEFVHILRLIIWCYGLQEWKVHFETMMFRIRDLFQKQVSRKNSRFVFTYLKDCYTILVSSLYSESHYVPKTRVSLDKRGFPRIIPKPLRDLMVEHKNVLLGVFTLLGLHRVIEYAPKVDLSTIVTPHKGETTTLDPNRLWKAIISLQSLINSKPSEYISKLNLGNIRGLLIEKAGPNGSQAYTRVIVDAFALTRDLGLLAAVYRWYYKFGGRRYLVSLTLILILGLPIWIFINTSLKLGRLGVVYNVAGKARVVAMTNWWIQVALHPLHKSIFDFLKVVPTDGTFDQHAPIKALCERKVGSKFYSLDLSAATDRLPMDLQVQILSMMTDAETAQLWRRLLSVPYSYKDSKDVMSEDIFYAVGQPMGAYSSWAMLALTHHIIVHYSNLNNELFRDYAVLGDDVVIQSDTVSQEYLRVMTQLGVEISLPKSMVALDHCEFAKRVFTKEGKTVSMISPGLFLAVLRQRLLAGMLVAEGFARDLYDHVTAGQMISSCPGYDQDQVDFGLWSLFGIRGLIVKDQQAARKLGVSWLSITKGHSEPVIAQSIFDAVKNQFIKRLKTTTDANNKALKAWYTFFDIRKYDLTLRILYLFDHNTRNSMFWGLPIQIINLCTHLLGYTLVFVSPIPWLVLDSILLALGEDHWNKIPIFPDLNAVSRLSSQIRELDIALLDNIAQKKAIDQFVRTYKEILHDYRAGLDGILDFEMSVFQDTIDYDYY